MFEHIKNQLKYYISYALKEKWRKKISHMVNWLSYIITQGNAPVSRFHRLRHADLHKINK